MDDINNTNNANTGSKNKIIFVAIVIIVAASLYYYFSSHRLKNTVNMEVSSKSNLIKVTSPMPGDRVKSPLAIEGEAKGTWFFEGSFPVKIIDDSGKELGQTPAKAQGDWMTEEFVPFKAEINFTPTTDKGTLVLEKDNPSGLPENADSLEVPIYFDLFSKPKAELPATVSLQVFFGKSNMQSNASSTSSAQSDCQKVYAVTRTIAQTSGVGKASLEQLLSGPTAAEKQKGYFTSLNDGVKLQKLNIENGVAKADFSDQLGKDVAGSCKIAAVRAQIARTLKQFSTVKDVVISINGKTEGILQP